VRVWAASVDVAPVVSGAGTGAKGEGSAVKERAID
jgi:hypothetical protein